MKRELLAKLLARSKALKLLRPLRARGLLALNYHRIATALPEYCDPDLLSASADAFEAQVKFLRQHAELIVPAEIEDARRDRRNRHVLITFDDGYRDNYDNAFRILKAQGARATFFIASDYIDHPRLPWWDAITALVGSTVVERIELPEFGLAPLSLAGPERAAAVRQLLSLYKALPLARAKALLATLQQLPGADLPDARSQWMDWVLLRAMHVAGMAIGGHTMHHPVLARLSRAEQQAEIDGCAARLRSELGIDMHCFAYPVGKRDSFNADSRDALRAAGVRYAFSYYGGFHGLRTDDDLDIRREPIEPHVSPELFSAICTLPQIFCRER
jgi:peptidoglycan/xylan/chitin deacetylase (PgdA/CDA1 family)